MAGARESARAGSHPSGAPRADIPTSCSVLSTWCSVVLTYARVQENPAGYASVSFKNQSTPGEASRGTTTLGNPAPDMAHAVC